MATINSILSLSYFYPKKVVLDFLNFECSQPPTMVYSGGHLTKNSPMVMELCMSLWITNKKCETQYELGFIALQFKK